MRGAHGGDKRRFGGGLFSCIGACAARMTDGICAVHARRSDDAGSRGCVSMTLRGAAPGVVLGAMCSAQGGRGVIPGWRRQARKRVLKN
jgi:hypothetical protein